jgi:hypothetical protein
MKITDDSTKLTVSGNGKLAIKTNITIVGTDTELPIDIVADFSNIPEHLHQIYYESMVYKYSNSVSIYNNVEPIKKVEKDKNLLKRRISFK